MSFQKNLGERLISVSLDPNHVKTQVVFLRWAPQKAESCPEVGKEQSRHAEMRDRARTGASALRLYTTPAEELKSHPRRLQELAHILPTLEKPGG